MRAYFYIFEKNTCPDCGQEIIPENPQEQVGEGYNIICGCGCQEEPYLMAQYAREELVA